MNIQIVLIAVAFAALAIALSPHRRARRLALFGGMLSLLGLAACDLQLGGSRDNSNSANAIVHPSGPTASPSVPPSGGCAAATQLTASVIEGQPVPVGAIVTLEVTVYVNGQALAEDSACGSAKVAEWSDFGGGSPCEFTTSRTGYHPGARARGPGSCSTSVSVDGRSVTLPIRVE